MNKRNILRFVALLATVALLAVSFGSVMAITDGELDGNGHPQVVLILMELGGQPAYRCSGTLISPTYVLTAGHCASNFPGPEFSGMRVFTESDVQAGRGTTNNYPFGGGASVEAVRFEAHPNYPNGSFVLNDVGMIELASPLPGPYASLADVGSLDGLQRGRQTRFTSVGYGLQLVNPVMLEANLIRMVAYPQLIQIDVPGFTGDFSMLLSNNAATGGTCFGDSGGPNFLGDSLVVAGVTSYGINGNCAGTGGVFRTDKQNVHDFVYGFMGS